MSSKGVFSYWPNVFSLMSVLPRVSLSEVLPRLAKMFPFLGTLCRALTDTFFPSFLSPASGPLSFFPWLCNQFSHSHSLFLIYLNFSLCTIKSISREWW